MGPAVFPPVFSAVFTAVFPAVFSAVFPAVFPPMVVAGVLLLLGVTPGPAAGSLAAPAEPQRAGARYVVQPPPEPAVTLADPRLTESSGLAASSRHPGLLWTVNDSGDGPHVYAVGTDGRVRARLTLSGVRAYDWEALALGPGGRLWVGDIGGNGRTRSVIRVHVVDEPTRLRSTSVAPKTFRLRYPDGPHDAEALLVHPGSGQLMVVSKDRHGGAFYSATGPLHSSGVTTLVKVGVAPAMVTDGAWAPDGSRFALRGYLSAWLFTGPGADERTLALPVQPQGESVAWSPDGRALLAGSEGAGSVVWRVAVPDTGPSRSGAAPTPAPTGSARAAPSRTTPAGSAGGSTGDSTTRSAGSPPAGGGPPVGWLMSAGLVAVLLAGAYWLGRRARTRNGRG